MSRGARSRRAFVLWLKALTVHKLRTMLALASVSAGVAAVVLTAAIGAGATRDVDAGIQSTGVNLIVVRPAQLKRLVGRQEIRGAATTLRLDDAAAIAALPTIAGTAAGIDGNAKVKAGTITTPARILGTTPAFPSIRRFRIAGGRFFDSSDDREGRRVAVLGARVADALFDGDATGRTIRLRGIPFDVIGVLQAKGVLADGDEDNQVLIPIHTALRRVFNATWLTTVYVSATDPRTVSPAIAEIGATLRARHRLTPDGQPDFEIQDARRYFALQRRAGDSLTMLTTSLGAAALLVGGTGIMALMLLSVKERTSEIGLRVAVGARPRDILAQFLTEATVLALGGWVGGIALALTGAVALALGVSWRVAFPTPAVIASFAMAIVIGLGFGAAPARKAAMVPPIKALGSK